MTLQRCTCMFSSTNINFFYYYPNLSQLLTTEQANEMKVVV